MKQKLQQFMSGRYGVDQLSKVMMYISLALLLISMISGWELLYFVAIILLGYSYFRTFSRNISKRYEENQKFLNWKYRLVVRKDQQKKHWEQRKIYHFYKCPSCKQKVRVPKGKGKICITCPKCKTEFIKHS